LVKWLIRGDKTIFFILLLGLILRLVAINQSLWLDEAIGAIAARDFTFSGILTDFIKADNHSPLYYLTLKAWTNIFGYSEVSIRFPSVIFGILTIYFAYRIAKLIIPSGKASFPIITSLLLSMSSFHIYYSQEARMYSMAAFFATTAFYYFFQLLNNEARRKDWVLFSVSITALAFTDYVPVFLLPVFWIIVFKKRKDINFRKLFLLAHALLVVLGILWLPTFIVQAERGNWLLQTWPAWKNVAGGATLKQLLLVWMKFVFGRISLSNRLLYYSLVVMTSIPVFLSLINSWKDRNKNVVRVWLWLIIPLLLGFLVSFNFPAFIYFRFVYVVPAFYLLISWGIEKIKNIRVKRVLFLGILTSNILSWFIYITNVNQQREQWREATMFVEKNAKSDEIVIFEFPEPFAPYRWYSKNLVQVKGITNSISVDPEKTSEITSKAIETKSGIYYFEYLRELSDPKDIVRKTLVEKGFIKKDVYNFQGVGFIEYYVKGESL